MPLTDQQKSVYTLIFSATMILRSIGKTIDLKNQRLSNKFKRTAFAELERLTDLFDSGKLREPEIVSSINKLHKDFKISYGQAQKAINVILKYHFYLSKNRNMKMKEILHCPLDSTILEILGRKKLKLSNIDEETYLEIQDEIKKAAQPGARIDYDNSWDEQHLKKWGLLKYK